ncbi:MAG: hypothetical protein NC133_02940 [Prevotella sp.]|nr:hypothetical protein [Prevotella sp.]
MNDNQAPTPPAPADTDPELTALIHQARQLGIITIGGVRLDPQTSKLTHCTINPALLRDAIKTAQAIDQDLGFGDSL